MKPVGNINKIVIDYKGHLIELCHGFRLLDSSDISLVLQLL